MRKINLVMMIMTFISCQSASLHAVQNKSIESLARENLGDHAVIERNKDSTFALCYKENDLTKSVSYLIIRSSDLAIIDHNTLSPSSLTWIDTYKVEVKTIPGIIKKDEQSLERKIIDLTHFIVKL